MSSIRNGRDRHSLIASSSLGTVFTSTLLFLKLQSNIHSNTPGTSTRSLILQPSSPRAPQAGSLHGEQCVEIGRWTFSPVQDNIVTLLFLRIPGDISFAIWRLRPENPEFFLSSDDPPNIGDISVKMCLSCHEVYRGGTKLQDLKTKNGFDAMLLSLSLSRC